MRRSSPARTSTCATAPFATVSMARAMVRWLPPCRSRLPDLTRLAVEHDDEFPAAKIADVISNGGGVLGHGSTAMLAWGLYFSEKRKPEVARARIKALVDYIESIQQK